jgi:hypothetical protein
MMFSEPLSILMNDRSLVRLLHQTYADKIESFYVGLKRCPGDPYNIRITRFGSARVAIARGHDWLNRATLTGDEELTLVDEIIRHFSTQGERCHIEWNPGNCYRSGTWDDQLGRHLLARGFRPGGFRCVWVANTATAPAELASMPWIKVRRFTAADLEQFLDVMAEMDPQPEASLDRRYGEGDEDWHHYVGYLDEVPCGTATQFINRGNGVAYLEWGTTLPAYRGRGLHRSMLHRRLSDAHAAGCKIAFAVTDVGVPSARNLQRQGFRLAYNYIMLVRDPTPIDEDQAIEMTPEHKSTLSL